MADIRMLVLPNICIESGCNAPRASFGLGLCKGHSRALTSDTGKKSGSAKAPVSPEMAHWEWEGNEAALIEEFGEK